MIYPFSFTDGTCVHCAAPQSLTFMDKYGKETKDPIYSATGLICKSCKTKFRIHWTNIDGILYPLCCSDEYKDEVVDNMIKYALQNRRKL